MSTKLFVGNLSFNLTENDLQDAFAAFGTMSSKEEADKAIAGLNGKPLDGRALTVNEARPREERPPGEGGGRDRGPRRPYSR